MTTLGQQIEAANRDPQLNAQYDAMIARYAEFARAAQPCTRHAYIRTVGQLRGCRKGYGLPSVLPGRGFEPGTECTECGAIPGFVHPASCTTNRYPTLGIEKPAHTEAINQIARDDQAMAIFFAQAG